jgi:hypothetical protein
MDRRCRWCTRGGVCPIAAACRLRCSCGVGMWVLARAVTIVDLFLTFSYSLLIQIFCMSIDGGQTCAGAGTNAATCNNLVKSRASTPSTTSPLGCTLAQYNTAGHVCQRAFRALGNGWNCIAGVDTPVKLDPKSNVSKRHLVAN